MNNINWFYLGAGLDLLVLLGAIWFRISKMHSKSGDRNPGDLRPTLLGFCGWIAGAFALRGFGHDAVATTMLWLPGAVLLGFGLMTVVFSMFQK